MSGVYLNDENCKLESLDSVPDDKKSSVFWIQFLDHNGNKVMTDKKVWINDFFLDKETNKGKTDFNFRWKVKDIPSVELKELMRKGVIVELRESRPIIHESKNDEGSVTKEVVLNEDNIPLTQEITSGLMKLDFHKWLFETNLQPEMKDIHSKFYFFENHYSDKPEFLFTNALMNFKDKDKALFVEYLDKVEADIEAAKKAAEPAPIAGGKGPAGKDAKKPAGKPAPAAKKGAVEDKNAPKAIVIEYPEIPMNENFIILEKEFNLMTKEKPIQIGSVSKKS